MSSFWSWFIIILTVANILACFWLINWTSKKSPDESDTTGHVWDGDLQEFNNPLPRWWLGLFYVTIVFSIVYLILYPGLGKFPGVLGWTQENQYSGEVAAAEDRFGALYAGYAATDLLTLSKNEEALRTGRNLFVNNCAQCHGSDARGFPGFPNLTDNSWIFGGDPETIKTSILKGRNGVMPAWGEALGEAGVQQVTEHVLGMNGMEHDPAMAREGQAKFTTFCASCHGPEGKGNPVIGAPDLTDGIWLYQGTRESIVDIVTNGMGSAASGVMRMPAHEELLGPERVHVLAAYVVSLSGDGGDGQTE